MEFKGRENINGIVKFSQDNKNQTFVTLSHVKWRGVLFCGVAFIRFNVPSSAARCSIAKTIKQY